MQTTPDFVFCVLTKLTRHLVESLMPTHLCMLSKNLGTAYLAYVLSYRLSPTWKQLHRNFQLARRKKKPPRPQWGFRQLEQLLDSHSYVLVHRPPGVPIEKVKTKGEQMWSFKTLAVLLRPSTQHVGKSHWDKRHRCSFQCFRYLSVFQQQKCQHCISIFSNHEVIELFVEYSIHCRHLVWRGPSRPSFFLMPAYILC